MRGKGHIKRDFDFYIDEYLYYCQSRRLRPKTMSSYEQTLRLFERWTREQKGIESPLEVREQTIRHYICDLQDRGKYSFYATAMATRRRPSRPSWARWTSRCPGTGTAPSSPRSSASMTGMQTG